MRFRSNKLLIKLVLSYLVTGALLTVLLLMVVSGFISGLITRQANQSARELLGHAYNTTYFALTDAYGDFYSLWAKDPAITEALHAATITDANAKAVGKILDDAAIRDTLVHSVCLINESSGLVLSNLAVPAASSSFYDPGALALFQNFENNYDRLKNEVFFPRQAAISLAGQQDSRNYISMIFTEILAGSPGQSCIIVNIDQARLSALVNTTPESNQMMIVNQSGKIISDLTGDTFAQDFPDNGLYQKILTGQANEGSMTADYLGNKSFIAYQKADRLGFVFISITPYSKLMAPVNQANRTIALLFGGAIFISLLASLFATRKIYQPLNALIRAMRVNPSVTTDSDQDEYSFLGDAYSSLISQSQQSHLSRLIQGHISSQTLEILDFSRSKFLAVVVMADQGEPVDNAWMEQLVQIIRSTIRMPSVVTANDSVSLVFNSDLFDETEMDWLVAQLATMQKVAGSELHHTVSVGIGSVVSDTDSIKASYRNALTAVQYALTLGSSQLVPFAEMESQHLAANLNRTAIASATDEYIQANYVRAGFTIDEIADNIGLSVGYLRQVFKLERGLPINDYIITCRITKACELLVSTEMTAKDISESVGYLDSRYFYTLFKKRVGMTTEEYRRSIQEVVE